METIRILFSWNDGGFIDLWSIVHILSGGVMGSLAIHAWNKTPFKKLLWIAIFLIVLWEYAEYVVGILESFGNIFTDIVLGIAGFILGYELPKKLKVDPYIILIPTFIVTIVLAYIGWINYLSR